MPRLKLPVHTRPIVLLVCLVALAASPASLLAADGPTFLGMRRCALCHNQSAMPDPEVSREFCSMHESGEFREKDKHARAYELMVVPGGVGEQMGKKLGIDVTHAKECLSCHSGMNIAEKERPPSYESGVTCESCHGASSRWDQPHSEPAWRKRSAAEKEKELGMIDVRDPVRRAKMCYSCHIGNTEEGKVVTHEMYAAGHPPLPGIEIETFVAAMPAHWRRLSEKGNFQFRDEYIKASGRASAIGVSGNLPRTQAVLVGGVVALRESLRLLAAQSAAAERPELAVYDCQSCHHELRSPTWRQKRPQLGRPGRPRPPEWATALALIGLEQLPVDATALKREKNLFDDGLRHLHEALDRQPFGSAKDLVPLIEDPEGKAGLANWLDQKARELANTPIDEAAARKVLQQLYERGASGQHDFHSARQIAWAIRMIETELRALPYPTFSPGGDATLTQRVQREGQDFQTLSKWRTENLRRAENDVASLLVPLTASMKLDLPSGPQKSVVEFMPASLSAISDYDPDHFRALLKKAWQESGKAGEPARRSAALSR